MIHTGPLGVNTYIVTLDGSSAFIVDPGCCSFCHDDQIITAYMKSNNLIPKAIILTHGHFDHIAGIKPLKLSFPEIKIIIHQEDVHLIGKNSQDSQSKSLSKIGFAEFLSSVSELPEADYLASDGDTLDKWLCDTPEAAEWKILHTPGHTPGSICLYNSKEKTLISGDTLFYHSWGRTDLDGGSEKHIIKSLERIKKEIPEETLVYPGHDYYGFKLKD